MLTIVLRHFNLDFAASDRIILLTYQWYFILSLVPFQMFKPLRLDLRLETLTENRHGETYNEQHVRLLHLN